MIQWINSPTQDEGIVGRLAGAREVQYHAALIGLQVHVVRDELATLIDADRLRIAGCSAHPVVRRHDIFSAVVVAHVEHGHVARECIDNGQNTQLLVRRQLVMLIRRKNDTPYCFRFLLIPSPRRRSARRLRRGRRGASPSPDASASCA